MPCKWLSILLGFPARGQMRMYPNRSIQSIVSCLVTTFKATIVAISISDWRLEAGHVRLAWSHESNVFPTFVNPRPNQLTFHRDCFGLGGVDPVETISETVLQIVDNNLYSFLHSILTFHGSRSVRED